MKSKRNRSISTFMIFIIVISLVFSGCSKDDTGSEAVPEVSGQDQTSLETALNDAIAEKEKTENALKEAIKIGEEAQKSEKEAREEQERLKEKLEAEKAEAEKAKAEEEAKKAEEIRIKAEEEAKAKEEKERNSFSMMYYLAITAENIRTSKDNRLVLDDIYTSLLNDINPGAIDEITQDHLNNLRDIIKAYLNVSTKRKRLQYIYNQNKAAAMRSAVPNPLSVLSFSNSLNWVKLAVSSVYTVVDSYNNYKSASESAEREFLMSGWELDDEELATIQKNRERAFNYMVDMVQEYDLDGLKTLSEKDIQVFSEICAIEYPTERIKRLRAEEKKYELLGSYWLELANCYFENSNYSQCLECVEKYLYLSNGIYKQDRNIAQILPKAIVAAQNTYAGDKYISTLDDYSTRILDNTTTEDWSLRYFVAQTYMDLYTKTNKQHYLEDAYKLISENVTVLLKGQREINEIYLNDIVEEVAVDPENTSDYKYMTEDEQDKLKEEYSKEKKRVKEYNKNLKEKRETELLSLYEPLILNCELMFSLAGKINVTQSEKNDMDEILGNNIFLVKPIENAYLFSSNPEDYNIELTKDEIFIPASLLTDGAKYEISVTDDIGITTFNDFEVSSVEREGSTIDSFKACLSSDQWEDYSWNENAHVTVKIVFSDAYDKELVLKYKVSKFEEGWWFFPNTVEFEKE